MWCASAKFIKEYERCLEDWIKTHKPINKTSFNAINTIPRKKKCKK